MTKALWKQFCYRGLVAGGFGPIVMAIIYWIISSSHPELDPSPAHYCLGILSGYVLAFLVAGCGIFYQVERWGLAKATFLHILVLYLCYLGCYLVNGWIVWNWQDVGIFSGFFVAGYLVIWAVIGCITKSTAKKLNEKIGK